MAELITFAFAYPLRIEPSFCPECGAQITALSLGRASQDEMRQPVCFEPCGHSFPYTLRYETPLAQLSAVQADVYAAERERNPDV